MNRGFSAIAGRPRYPPNTDLPAGMEKSRLCLEPPCQLRFWDIEAACSRYPRSSSIVC